jgi:hypothetical protein
MSSSPKSDLTRREVFTTLALGSAARRVVNWRSGRARRGATINRGGAS